MDVKKADVFCVGNIQSLQNLTASWSNVGDMLGDPGFFGLLDRVLINRRGPGAALEHREAGLERVKFSDS